MSMEPHRHSAPLTARGMPWPSSARRRRVTEPMPLPRTAETRPRRDPSITVFGLNCFRLVRIADPDTGLPGYVPVRRLASGTPMGALTRR